jgi:hypothetical protein
MASTSSSAGTNNLQSWYESSSGANQARSIESSTMTPMPVVASTTGSGSSNITNAPVATSEQALAAFGALAALGLKGASSIIASSSAAVVGGSNSANSIDLEAGGIQSSAASNATNTGSATSSVGFGLEGILSSYLSGNSKSSAIPGSSSSSTPSSSSTSPEWTCGMSATQRFQAFALLACSSVSLYFASFFIFLPMLLFAPSKFATAFTFASIMWLLGFAILWGPKSTLTSLIAPDKRAFTLSYIGSLLLTLYAAFVSQSYFLIMLAIAIQLTSAMYYTASYFPGGTMAAGALSRMCIGSVRAMLTSASR